jgi:hypothetical protein
MHSGGKTDKELKEGAGKDVANMLVSPAQPRAPGRATSQVLKHP